MARFASQYRNFAIGQIRAPEAQRLGHDGNMIPAVKALGAQFERRLVEKADIDAVQTGLRGKIHGEQERPNGEKVSIIHRISAFDSQLAQRQLGWTDEERELVEKHLREDPLNGSAYVEVIQAPADKPWNGYDHESDPQRILELALAIDADLRKVLEYERENEKRPEVIGVLEDAIQSGEEAVIVSA